MRRPAGGCGPRWSPDLTIKYAGRRMHPTELSAEIPSRDKERERRSGEGESQTAEP